MDVFGVEETALGLQLMANSEQVKLVLKRMTKTARNYRRDSR